MFVALFVSGLALGMVAALAALGTVVLYKATGVFNFATGDQITLGAYLAVYTSVELGWNTFSSYLFSVGTVAITGIAMERIVYRPVRDRSPYVTVIATLGVALAMRAALGVWQGSDPKSLPSPLGRRSFQVGDTAVSAQRVLIVVISALAVTLLTVVFGRTGVGRQVRALASDRDMAQLMGVRVNWLSLGSWALSAAVAGLAGILFAPLVPIDLTLGFTLMIAAFSAAIVGGFGSFIGVTIGALVLSLSQEVLGGYFIPEFRFVIPLLLVVAVIAFRPQGIVVSSAVRVRV